MARKPDRGKRFAQIRAVWQLTRRNDRRLLPYLAAGLLVPIAVLLGVGFLAGQPIYFGVLGLLSGIAVAVIIFGRRASKAVYSQVEGQPGAAVAIIQGMRGNWQVTPAVAVTTQQDLVHRVVGRPGVVLVGEGNPRRVGQLLGQEKKRVGRVVGDTPVYDIVVGDGDGQLPLRKIQNYLTKLPRNIAAKDVAAVDRRLQALGGARMPMPKGPTPKGMRAPGARRLQRGRR